LIASASLSTVPGRTDYPSRKKRIMLVIGEASGDLHGAQVVKALREQDPALEIFGAGGEKLKEAGVRILFDAARLAGMGFSEVIGNIGNVWQGYWLLRRVLKQEKPDLLILIDFPEFNLRLAHLAKKLGVPVLYYISPQVWAWRSGRIRKIARRVDRMAVVFPFEVSLYQRAGVPVSFVGHPLLDVVRSTESREQTLRRYGLDPAIKTIVLLPGSRRREVAYHLPPMVQAAGDLSREMPLQFILVRAGTVEKRFFEAVQQHGLVKIAVAEGDAYNVLNASDLVWTASGTATLETALMLRPMIVMYRFAWLTYALARLLVRVKHIALVNIVAGEGVVPELIQSDVTAERIVLESRRILEDASVRERIVKKLSQVREKLGSPGAANQVAGIALSMMNEKKDRLQKDAAENLN